MDAYRVIRHPGDQDEGARWACRAWQQRGPVEIASGPAPVALRLGRTWLSASTGGEIFLFIPLLARLIGLPNGRVSAEGSPGRTDDGTVVRDFKLEPTARDVKSRKAVPRAVNWFERGGFRRVFLWFCFSNEKLNSPGCKKFSNQRTNLKLCIRTYMRWYSLRVVTYLR